MLGAMAGLGRHGRRHGGRRGGGTTFIGGGWGGGTDVIAVAVPVAVAADAALDEQVAADFAAENPIFNDALSGLGKARQTRVCTPHPITGLPECRVVASPPKPKPSRKPKGHEYVPVTPPFTGSTGVTPPTSGTYNGPKIAPGSLSAAEIEFIKKNYPAVAKQYGLSGLGAGPSGLMMYAVGAALLYWFLKKKR